jgi:hypothetical protein
MMRFPPGDAPRRFWKEAAGFFSLRSKPLCDSAVANAVSGVRLRHGTGAVPALDFCTECQPDAELCLGGYLSSGTNGINVNQAGLKTVQFAAPTRFRSLSQSKSSDKCLTAVAGPALNAHPMGKFATTQRVVWRPWVPLHRCGRPLGRLAYRASLAMHSLFSIFGGTTFELSITLLRRE